MTDDPAWRKYETEIAGELDSKFPASDVEHSVRLPGLRSLVDRQIDVLVTERVNGTTIRIAVEAKRHGRPIDVKHVESFLGMLQDVEVDRGIMVSPLGYSEAAYTRAHRDDVDLDLDIFSLDEFKQWQAEWAIPYAGNVGVVLPSRFGWLVEIGPFPEGLARLYRRGLDFEAAIEATEFAYVNLWNRADAVSSLDLLLKKQANDILRAFPDALLSVGDFGTRRDFPTCIRRAEIPSYPGAELTAFVEFENFIFYAVLHSRLAVERKNLRKLQYVIDSVSPISIEQSDG